MSNSNFPQSQVGSAIRSAVESVARSSTGSIFGDFLFSASTQQQQAELTRADLNNIFNALGKDQKELQAYLDNPENWLCEEGDLTPLMTKGDDDLSSFSLPELESRLRDVEDAGTELQQYRDELEKHLVALRVDVGDHLWISPDFTAPATVQLTQKIHEADALLARLETLREVLGVRKRAEALKR